MHRQPTDSPQPGNEVGSTRTQLMVELEVGHLQTRLGSTQTRVHEAPVGFLVERNVGEKGADVDDCFPGAFGEEGQERFGEKDCPDHVDTPLGWKVRGPKKAKASVKERPSSAAGCRRTSAPHSSGVEVEYPL